MRSFPSQNPHITALLGANFILKITKRAYVSLVLKLRNVTGVDLRKYKIKIFFLQRASGGEQDRLGPFYSVGNTADSVFLQYSGG